MTYNIVQTTYKNIYRLQKRNFYIVQKPIYKCGKQQNRQKKNHIKKHKTA